MSNFKPKPECGTRQAVGWHRRQGHGLADMDEACRTAAREWNAERQRAFKARRKAARVEVEK